MRRLKTVAARFVPFILSLVLATVISLELQIVHLGVADQHRGPLAKEVSDLTNYLGPCAVLLEGVFTRDISSSSVTACGGNVLLFVADDGHLLCQFAGLCQAPSSPLHITPGLAQLPMGFFHAQSVRLDVTVHLRKKQAPVLHLIGSRQLFRRSVVLGLRDVSVSVLQAPSGQIARSTYNSFLQHYRQLHLREMSAEDVGDQRAGFVAEKDVRGERISEYTIIFRRGSDVLIIVAHGRDDQAMRYQQFNDLTYIDWHVDSYLR